jgi:DNA repair exonuclease SbcCD nuclease subunit
VVVPSPDTRRPATVLHTSDCHLGTSPARRQEAAFAEALALARRERVDAVLVVGDLFDSARMSEEILDWTAAQLDALHCPVVILPGNHDVFDDGSVHHRFDIGVRCPHVQFVDDHGGRLFEVPGTDLVVWGRAMPEHEPGYLPFAGLPPPPEGKWAIAAGHGLVMDDGPSHRSSPIFASDLAAVEWDYVALGHVHRYQEVRDEPTPVRYSGATAESRKGDPGVVLVEFVPGVGARPRSVALEVPVPERKAV